MTRISFGADRVLAVPADIVYHCLADYAEHHRPEGFLPPAFTALRVERGGVGAGTVITYSTLLGGSSRTVTREVSEPEPGRVLVESGDGDVTTFTVDPQGPERCRLRIDTILQIGGVQGLVARFMAPRLLQPVYADEMQRLEAHALAHGPLN
jgi:hypothetical protein